MVLLVDDILGERPAGLAQSQTYPQKYALAGHRIGVGMGFSVSMFRLPWGAIVLLSEVPCVDDEGEEGAMSLCCPRKGIPHSLLFRKPSQGSEVSTWYHIPHTFYLWFIAGIQNSTS